MENCIFCKIIKGEIPSHKIYEDEYVYAFLDISPANKGHTLVIPKKHYENTLDAPDMELTKVITATKKLAILLKEKLNADGINIVNANGKIAQQSVFHLHYHIVPRYKEDGLDLWFHGESQTNKNTDLEELKKTILN